MPPPVSQTLVLLLSLLVLEHVAECRLNSLLSAAEACMRACRKCLLISPWSKLPPVPWCTPQPECVLIDISTLGTLPDRELASGISEIIKYGLIRDAPFFEWLEANMNRLLARDEEVAAFATLQ